MRKLFLFLSILICCAPSLQAQWKKVLDLGVKASGSGPMVAFRSKLFASFAMGTCLSEDTGKTWKVIDSNKVMNGVVQFLAQDSLLLANTFDAGIFISKDSGKTWQITDSTLPFGINRIAMVGSDLIAASTYNIFVSKDFGKHWLNSNKGLPSKPPTFTSFLTGLFSFDGKLNIFYRPYSYLSYDHGASWHRQGDSCYFANETAVIGNRLFASLGNRICLSTDTSETWKRVLYGVPPASTLQHLWMDSRLIVAGFDHGGVAVSKDSGDNWYYINDGLPNVIVGGVAILGDYIFAGLWPGLIYKRPMQEITGASIINEKHNFQSSFYPNPARHSAIITFNRELNNGQVTIFDMLGRILLQINRIDTDGIRVEINNLASGTYIYIISEAGETIGVAKFEVVKQ